MSGLVPLPLAFDETLLAMNPRHVTFVEGVGGGLRVHMLPNLAISVSPEDAAYVLECLGLGELVGEEDEQEKS